MITKKVRPHTTRNVNARALASTQCLCYAIPILNTEEDCWANDSEDLTESINEVSDPPEGFKEWVRVREQYEFLFYFIMPSLTRKIVTCFFRRYDRMSEAMLKFSAGCFGNIPPAGGYVNILCKDFYVLSHDIQV